MRRKAKIHLACSIAVMALIFIHSAMPSDISSAESGLFVDFVMERFAALFGNDPEAASFFVRKCAHFLEYTLLGFSFSITASDYSNPWDSNAAAKLIPWALGTLYAVTDEFHQMFVPGRSCEIRDMCIDSCGVAAGVLIGSVWMWWKSNREKNR